MSHFLRHLSKKIAMLLVAVMLLVPVSEAFSCSFEPASAHADGTSVAETPSDDQGSSDHSHGLCGHNHCHHTAASAVDDHDLDNASLRGSVSWAIQDVGRLSGPTDGLLRPPRI